MNGRVIVDFTAAEGSVVRIVGLVERRGFRLRGLSMQEEEAERASLTLDLEARDAQRRFDMLGLQLGRLHEVSNVSVFNPEPGQVQ